MRLLARPAPSGGGRVLVQLDALRGVAILAVFVQHLGDRFSPFLEARIASLLPALIAPWALTIFHHAWWGVDLFFVLSGFSLAQGYVSAFAAGRAGPSARVFLARRAARIVPAFLVAIAVMIAARPSVVRIPGFPAALAAHLALLQGYVTPGGIVLIGAAWSLTTEAHFYLLFPLFARPLLDPSRRARRWIFVGAICALAWGSRALLHAWILEPGVHTALLEASQRRWISSRLDQFALGAFAAAIRAAILGSPHAAEAARRAPVALALAVAALVVALRLEGRALPGSAWLVAVRAALAGDDGAGARGLATRRSRARLAHADAALRARRHQLRRVPLPPARARPRGPRAPRRTIVVGRARRERGARARARRRDGRRLVDADRAPRAALRRVEAPARARQSGFLTNSRPGCLRS